MGLFNDIGKKTTQTTNKIAKETKLKLKINENKSKIKDLYGIIGKKIYENHVREEKIDTENAIIKNCNEIDKLSDEIEKARKEILILNNKKMCKKCFAEIQTDDNYCPKCGERQTEQKNVFEQAEEKLEQADISPKNKKEAEIIKEELEKKNNDN